MDLDECDQMASLLVQYLTFATLNICPKPYKICQNKFKIFPD